MNINNRCWMLRRLATSASALKKPSKFFKKATVVRVDSGENPHYNILLDQRRLKSPAGHVFETESEPLAYAICQEWDLQQNVLRLDRMLLTKLFFTALDNPLGLKKEDVVRNTMEYFETDTILYRNGEIEKLKDIQARRWDPIIAWASDEFELKVEPTFNVTEVAKVSEASRRNLQRYLLAQNFFALTGIQFGVESVKSLLLTLAAISCRVQVPEAVELALLEQRYQTDLWGKVEWAHDVEYEELVSRLSAATLFVHFSRNVYHKDYKKS